MQSCSRRGCFFQTMVKTNFQQFSAIKLQIFFFVFCAIFIIMSAIIHASFCMI
eukprot:05896.XXX_40143_40301_1 [CDS] Oithona nana genome sequencing.